LINGVRNITNWENWNWIDQSRFERGSKCSNLEDFMGEGKCCWMCPVSAWGDLRPVDLMTNYQTYDEIMGEATESIHD
jgi:hypothetical protein